MLSTVPAMSSLIGCVWYMARSRLNIMRHCGSSSYILISWPMMPSSFSTVCFVKYGDCTKSSKISSACSAFSVQENR